MEEPKSRHGMTLGYARFLADKGVTVNVYGAPYMS